MIRRVLFCLIWCVSVGVLSSCMFNEPNDGPVSSVPETLVEISISPTASMVIAEPTLTNSATTVMSPVVLTDTPVLPSVETVTPTPSPTVLPINYPVTCSDWQEPVPLQQEEGLAGVLGLVLPLTAVPNTESNNWAVIGGTPLQQRELFSANDFVGIGFSPDGDWFAYQMLPESNSPGEQPLPFVYLMSFDGQTIATPIPLPAEESNGNWYAQWITDELMILQYFPASQSTEIWLLGSYTLFNPFTGERYDDFLKSLPYCIFR